MDHLSVDPVRPDRDVIRRAVAILLRGGVVAYPTDTLYGLAVDPRKADAVQRLFAVKERGEEHAIPLIAADQAQVEQQVGVLSDLGRRIAARFWPGPLTLVIDAHPGALLAIHGGTGRVAVRVPDHAVARLFAAECGCAITSTSANVTGQPAPGTASDLAPSLCARLDAVLDAGPTPGGRPSTIVDATGATPVLLRDGVVPWTRVLECL